LKYFNNGITKRIETAPSVKIRERKNKTVRTSESKWKSASRIENVE